MNDLRSKWVYTVKRNENGEIQNLKPDLELLVVSKNTN